MIFCKTPSPLWKFQLSFIFWSYRTPPPHSPQEIPIPSVGECGYFLDLHIHYYALLEMSDSSRTLTAGIFMTVWPTDKLDFSSLSVGQVYHSKLNLSQTSELLLFYRTNHVNRTIISELTIHESAPFSLTGGPLTQLIFEQTNSPLGSFNLYFIGQIMSTEQLFQS